MIVAIVCSNLYNVDKTNKTGTGIFNNILVNNLAKLAKKSNS